VELKGATVSVLIPHRGGGEMKGRRQEREWTCRGGNPVARGAGHGRHYGDGWNRWRRRLVYRRWKMTQDGLG
jgi:hypothetical protein